MNTRVIITGFNAYGRVTENPSAALVLEVARKHGAWIIAEVLNTSYQDATGQIRQLIREHPGAPVVMFGHSDRAHGFRIDAVARNADTSRQRDNDGHTGSSPIIRGAPATYRSTADIDMLAEALRHEGVPVAVSDRPTGFVCNHAYFAALHELAASQSDAACLFVHMSPPDFGMHETMIHGGEMLAKTARRLS
jgi:pyroglutamyl-peptidase